LAQDYLNLNKQTNKDSDAEDAAMFVCLPWLIFFLGFRGLPSNPLHDPPLFDLERGRADG